MNRPTPAQNIDRAKQKQSNKAIDDRIQIEKSLQVVDRLSCPKDMSEEAQKEWRRLMKLYKKMDARILCDLDKSSLRMYCESYALFLQSQKQLNEIINKYRTIVSADKKANGIIQSLLKTINKQSEICVKLSDQLCLTPIGRARMGVAVAKFGLKEEKSLDDFFSKFEDDEDEEKEEDGEPQMNIEDFEDDEE